MPAFTYDGLAPSDIEELAKLARATYTGNTPPPGWSTITGETIGGGAYVGNTFNNGGAAARVFRNQDGTGDTLTIAFRGTDNALGDFFDITGVLFGDGYINQFADLMNAVAAYVPTVEGITKVQVTGHSLGGAAANSLASNAQSAFGGFYADVPIVAFASPRVSTSNDILNIGHENDWIFKAFNIDGVPGLPEFFSANDHIFWYNDLLALHDTLSLPIRTLGEFFSGQPWSAHADTNYIETVQRITGSEFYGETTRDMTILVAATDFEVRPLSQTSTNASGPALVLGREGVADILTGGTANDFLEGLGGNDFMRGDEGNDNMSGGAGADELMGGRGNDTMDGGSGRDVVYFQDLPGNGDLRVDLRREDANATNIFGIDTVIRVEDVVGTSGDDGIIGNASGNLLVGVAGSDTLTGHGGDDTLMSGDGAANVLNAGAGDDVLDMTQSRGSVATGGTGADTFIFDERFLDVFSSNAHTIRDYDDGADFLMIDGGLLTSFADLTITQLGSGDTRLSIGTLQLTLENTQAGLLDAGDVVFF